jgi:hypothetical protein
VPSTPNPNVLRGFAETANLPESAHAKLPRTKTRKAPIRTTIKHLFIEPSLLRRHFSSQQIHALSENGQARFEGFLHKFEAEIFLTFFPLLMMSTESRLQIHITTFSG